MERLFMLVYWEPRAQPKVYLMLPLGYSMEASHDQVMVCVVTGILDRNILEQTSVHPKDVVRLGTHLLATIDNDPRPAVPVPRYLMGEELLCHIFQIFRCHRF